MRFESFTSGTCHRDAVERRAPALDVLLAVGFRQFPEVDQAGTGVGERIVDRVAILDRMNAAIDRLVAKHMVDRLQDRRSRAERIGERYRIEFQPGILELLLQAAATQVEFPGGGALKRKDRLLFVADREHRPDHAIARAGAGGEFGNDVRDDVPLPGTGVLRFVDQHMIDAAVELVMHPAGRHAVEHRQRFVDQIVIVEQAAFLLLAPVIRCRRGRDMQQRLGAVAGGHRAAAFDQGAKAADFGLQTGGQPQDCRAQNSLSPPICAACGRCRSGTRRDTRPLALRRKTPMPPGAAPA